MGKMPFFQLYPLDWLRDTRQLSHRARAVWIDVLCIAWNEPERGIYERREDMAAQELGLDICLGHSCRKDDVICGYHHVMAELSYVADVTFDNLKVTIASRRMMREENARKNNAKKQDVYRRNHKVTDVLQKVTANKLEVISQKSYKSTPTPSPHPPKNGQPDFMDPIGQPQESAVPDLAPRIVPGPRRGKVIRSVSEPVRKLLMVYKRLQGFAMEDAKWDRVYFRRFAENAGDLLDVFDGDYKIAAMCLAELAGTFDDKELTWTLNTIVNHAAEWKSKHATPEPQPR